MSRPRRVSDEEVFAAVRRTVLEQGPQVSLDVVAESLNVSAPALFRRFGSRKALLVKSLSTPDRPDFIDFLEQGPDARPISDQLVDMCGRITGYLEAALPCMSALRESGILPEEIFPRPTEPAPLLTLRSLTGWLERARARGLLAFADAQAAALILLGAIQAPVFIRHIAYKHAVPPDDGSRTASPRTIEPIDTAAYGQRLVRMLLDGLAPR